MDKHRRKPGRPPGKKSDPNYVQISAYVQVSTYKAIKHACIDDDLEISELVQQLLAGWLVSRTQKHETQQEDQNGLQSTI